MRTVRTVRPVGLSAGTLGLVLAWGGGAAIARLTGATPVVIVLGAGAVMFVAAALSGWWSLRGTEVRRVAVPPMVDVGAEVPIEIEVRARRAMVVELRHDGHLASSGWTTRSAGRWVLHDLATFDRRGRIEQLEVRLRSAGSFGLVWWSRAHRLTADLVVAPSARPGAVGLRATSLDRTGEHAGPVGAVAGEIDGIRPWRDGDSERWVHWSSTLRAGELVVHDRRHDADRRVVVRARPGRADPDVEAGAARAALDRALRSGATTSAAVGDAEPDPIADRAAAARWSALAPLGAAPDPPRRRHLRWQRPPAEPDTTAAVSARWWAAATTLVSLLMLTQALGYSPPVAAMVVLGVVAGAAVSARSLVSGEPPSALVRTLVGIGALGSLALVAAATGRLDGLLGVLRGPLPQILLVLIVLHGFECRDRRTIRVALAIAAVVLMYAAGFRVDGTLGWWLLVWGVCFGAALVALAGPADASADGWAASARWRPTRGRRRSDAREPVTKLTGRLAGLGVGCLATVGLLAVVPVPDGPARLTLPTLIEGDRDAALPGAVVGPDGEVRDDGGAATDGERAPAGQAGGYAGFAQSMDTSVRGALSDEIVMRVRAPEPDFWRGQTFSTFDGRRWHADDDTGVPRNGPNVDVPSALGDIGTADDVEVERFVQTYHIAVDMPNVVFGAYRPVQLIIDADVWTRSDGAIRSSVVHTEGSIYTVVSARPRVTEELLRRQGEIGPRLSGFGREVLGRYLQVPESTSPETIALANRLAADSPSTYDTVRAYESWLAANVEYDLNAPLPDPGEDAVHDFLFDSRRGFCEQIASALTIMLRTQGVPARVATGYLPGARDQIAGVWEVRAADAHAWVEVWFPETGWQAFDPTASVPLSGDARVGSVGADLTAGVGRYVGDHPLIVVSAVLAGVGGVAGWRLMGEVRHRRRRGRWGVLQDRFAALAARRGAPPLATNPRRAGAWADDPDAARTATEVAERLDRVEFDPTFGRDADDVTFAGTRKLVGSLDRHHR